MSTPDFFRSRLDQMIDLRHPLAVLATRLPWASIEAAVAPKLARQAQPAKRASGQDLAVAFDGEHLGSEPDIVFECVGKPGVIDHCIGLVRPRGKVVVLGLCTPRDHMDSFRAISKEVNIVMSVFFDLHEFGTAIQALDSGQMAPQSLVSETVSLVQLPDAFEALRSRTTQCKVLIDPFVA
jgi:(R,R)-butanediol dehydrogenase/meso-butanediol dehydrogenase/diacetyl reductase